MKDKILLKKLGYKSGASNCSSCLYKRGLIKTFINPCVRCGNVNNLLAKQRKI